jgi:hypothetical protein
VAGKGRQKIKPPKAALCPHFIAISAPRAAQVCSNFRLGGTIGGGGSTVAKVAGLFIKAEPTVAMQPAEVN